MLLRPLGVEGMMLVGQLLLCTVGTVRDLSVFSAFWVGESPESAHAMSYHVLAIRYGAVLFGGAMAGIGGAFLSTVYTPMWIENMVAGRGWIAIALVVFAA